jgi:hypothetical protein
MDDNRAQSDVDIRFSRLTIGRSGSRVCTRTLAHHRQQPHRSRMQTGRSQTEWFDELLYGTRPRTAQPSSSSTESESDSAIRPVSPTWYDALQGDNENSTSSRMRYPPSVPPSTTGQRSMHHDQQRQNSLRYRDRSHMNDGDIERLTVNGSEV